MLEKTIERRLKTVIERECPGSMCLKFEVPSNSGFPDRIILLPGERVVFVETKRPGESERPRQVYVQGKLRALGFTVFSSIRDPAGVASVLAACRGAAENVGR